jgi:hypothetical protein
MRVREHLLVARGFYAAGEAPFHEY